MAETLAGLESIYCPPIDPPTFFAIISDYDLDNAAELQAAKATLDQLKESALLEDATDFDPSGTSTLESAPAVRALSSPSVEASDATTHSTDVTSLSQGISSIELEPQPDMLGDVSANDVESLDEETKCEILQEVFKEQINAYTIKHTLKKCNGRCNAAFEELLNLVHLENKSEDGHVGIKSVDAFSEDNMIPRRRKGKHKGLKAGKRGPWFEADWNSPSPTNDPAISRNRWEIANKDIEFISSRTKLERAVVSSAYHRSGMSLPRTIRFLVDEKAKNPTQDGKLIVDNARDLCRDFQLSLDHAIALIRLTYPSTSTAHELAKAMTTEATNDLSGGIQIIPTYVLPDGLDSDGGSTYERGTRSLASLHSTYMGDATLAARREAYNLAKAAAFSQASAAHRKAKSDRLMGGAAAYYGQLGRDYTALSQNASAAAADHLVSTQSSPTQLDLHGVDVVNAIRIACEKVGLWWAGLGESKFNGRLGAQDRSLGYRIVVGSGRHSEGGKGKLGPAVTRALREEGWKVEPFGAVLQVTGPMKR